MKSNKYLVILLFLLFIPYFLKPTIIGYDSYYFVNASCLGTELKNTPILSEIFFKTIPCNLFLFKLVLFTLTLTSLLLLKKTATLINKSHGWLAPYFILGSPLWLEFLKFEDDQLSFPFLVASIYFTVKFLKDKNKLDYFTGIAFALIGLLFWKGAIYYLIQSMAVRLIGVLAVLALMFFIERGVLSNLIPNLIVFENYPGVGILNQYWLLLGYFTQRTILWPLLSMWTVLALLKAKFMLHLGFVLAILATGVFKRFNQNQKYLFTGVIVATMIFSSIFIMDRPVTEQQHNAIIKAVEYSKETNQPLRNDLMYGYYMQHIGYDTIYTPGNYAIDYFNDFNGVVLSPFDSNCFLVEGFGKTFVYDC